MLLKKHRPHEFIEKTVSLSLEARTELPAADGKMLLQAMLGQGGVGPAGQPALPPAIGESAASEPPPLGP